MIHVTIDSQEIQTEPGRTILEVAREQNIHIPTLCYHEAMKPFAACRLCVVEVVTQRGGQLVASCAYPCTDGLTVCTNSDAVLQSRRITVELLMASARHIPIIRQLAKELGFLDTVDSQVGLQVGIEFHHFWRIAGLLDYEVD